MNRQKYLNCRNSNSITLDIIYEGMLDVAGFKMDFNKFNAVFMSLMRPMQDKIAARAISNLDKKYNIQTLINRQGLELWCES